MDQSDFFEHFPVPCWIFDVQTLVFLAVNPAAIDQYGYSREEFLSMDINQIRQQQDREKIVRIVMDNQKTEAFFRDVFTHLTKKGQLIHVQIASNATVFNNRRARLVVALDVSDRIAAQSRMLESERRFEAIVKNSSDLIWIVDQRFRLGYLSSNSSIRFGSNSQGTMGQEIFDFVHTDDLQLFRAEMNELLGKRNMQLTPYRHLNSNNSWTWVETRATNMLEDPSVSGILCTSKDITGRIASERLLAQNIERYNIVSKATSDVIWDCDLEQGEILWNRALKGVLGYRQCERTTLDWWKQRIHQDDRERVLHGLQACLEHRIPRWQDEYRFLCGSGGYKNIFDRGFVIFDADGRGHRMIGAMQDITQRKQREEWSRLLESVVVNASDGVVITDAGQTPRIIYVNQAMVQMSGFSEAELLGCSPAIFHGGNTSQDGLERLDAAISSGSEVQVELVNYKKNGEEFFVSISLSPVLDDGRKVVRWISIQRDVTQQRRYIEQIRHKNRVLQEIKWLQSHVVRTPLARIMSLVELLESGGDDRQQAELLLHLRSSADELDKIIRRISENT